MSNFEILTKNQLFGGELNINPNEFKSISIVPLCGKKKLTKSGFSKIVGHGIDTENNRIILAVTNCLYGGSDMMFTPNHPKYRRDSHSWITLDMMSSMYIFTRSCDNA